MGVSGDCAMELGDSMYFMVTACAALGDQVCRRIGGGWETRYAGGLGVVGV